MRLERKDSAKFSKSKLLNTYNDIDIYIEDTAKDYEKLYVNIFKRAFNGKYKINNVYPIGARGKVINKCKEKSNNIKRPTLFVVDGDLYILNGEKTLPKGVFRLPCYCIENILLDSSSIIKYIDEEHPSLREEEIKEKFLYDKWKNLCKEPLTMLFLRYAIIQKLNVPNAPNVSISIKNFLDSNDETVIDKDKVERKISELDELIISHVGEDKFNHEKNEIISIMDSAYCKLSVHVSGKDYLYPMIHKKVSLFLNKPIAHINFKQRLALSCDISQIADCQNTVLIPNV